LQLGMKKARPFLNPPYSALPLTDRKETSGKFQAT